jgi:hypothetical protein
MSPPPIPTAVHSSASPAVEVVAMLGDSVIGVRHILEPSRRPAMAVHRALFATGALLLVIAATAFAFGVRSARLDAHARRHWIEVEQRPAWQFRPSRIGPLGDAAAFGGLVGGLACLALALGRRRRQDDERAITIGHGPGVDFATELGGERFELVAAGAGGLIARVPPGAALEPAVSARAVDDIVEVPIAPGQRMRIARGAQTYVIAAVAAPARLAVEHHLDRRLLAFAGASALAHLLVLALIDGIAPDPRGLNDDLVGLDRRLAAVKLPAHEEPAKLPAEPAEAGGGAEQGGATLGASGAMGKVDATSAIGRFQHQRRSERERFAAKTSEAARAEAREAGILGFYQPSVDDFGVLASTQAFSSGIHERMVHGGHLGDDVGEAAGGWGYGVWGFGPGAGGKDAGTIAVGEYDLVGPGGDGGDRLGTCGGGRSCGGSSVRRHAASVPPPVVGDARSTGGLDKQIIRAHIRRKLPQIRHCYERALIGAPSLAGTTTVQFQITPQGVVQGVRAAGLGGGVDDCVADVIGAIEFPRPTGGGYVNVTSYPFTFSNPG